jgi:peptidoglycan-N-acetylglucosamine deacetylase
MTALSGTRKTIAQYWNSISIFRRRNSQPKKLVWLTFDDGPHPVHTDMILRTLDKHKISAAFFVVGLNAERHHTLVKRAFDAGHRIGNHSYSHKYLTKITEPEIRNEIKRTDEILQAYLGQDKLFRPPYGAHNATVDRIAASCGYRIVKWNVDPRDLSPQFRPDGWVQNGIDQIKLKSVSTVISHDMLESTANNFDVFVQRIKQLGNVDFAEPPPPLTS